MNKNKIGEIFQNNNKETFQIIEYYDSRNITIKFNDNTILKNIHYGNIINGKVKNPNNPNIYNIGYLGIGKYNGNYKKTYIIWTQMLRRCYDKKFLLDNQTYIDCSVDERWHNFQVFAEWFEKNYIDGFVLDKDILIKGNKVYGPDTCCFVPQEINNLFVNKNKNDNLPANIYLTPNKKKFRSQFRYFNLQKNLGVFDKLEDAIENLQKEKQKYMFELAEIWKNKLPEKTLNSIRNYYKNQ